jgi:hypothetical protein
MQPLETGGQCRELCLDVVWLLELLWLLHGCSRWLLWLLCEIVDEGLTDDGC